MPLVGVALLTTTPLSVHWSPTNGGKLVVRFETAKAADLAYPHRAYHRGHRRAALYDPYCGGPYVGPGWHGGHPRVRFVPREQQEQLAPAA